MKATHAPEVLSRRTVLVALAAAPMAALTSRADARDYGSAAEVFAEIARLEVEVEARLGRIAAAVPGTARLARSVAATHTGHRAEREDVRRRLRISAAGASVPTLGRDAAALDALRMAAQDLVHAHAEGLPALEDATAVDVLARHMVDVQRHLTVIDLWIQAEEERG